MDLSIGPSGRKPGAAGRFMAAGAAVYATLAAPLPCVAADAHSLAVPAAFMEGQAEGPTVDADGEWWKEFSDPLLGALIAQAATSNRDILASIARIDAARAAVTDRAADLWPNIDALGSASKSDTGYDARVHAVLPDITTRRLAASGSWEIDLFGRVRAARSAAIARANATAAARRAVTLSVASEVAEQYFILRGAQEQRRILEDLIASERETRRLVELRASRGTASDFDVDRSRGEVADTEALVPRLDALAAVTGHHLAVLTGRSPEEAPLIADAAGTALPVPAFPVAQPADVLRRRPDVMAAEQAYRAAGFDTEEARANQFPHLIATALFGREWTDVNMLNIGPARFLNAAGALSVPIFGAGRYRAAVRANAAAQRAAQAEYEQTVLRALQDVESAMAAATQDAARFRLLQTAIDARTAAFRRAQALFAAGEIDLLQLLDVERALLNARLNAATTHTARLIDAVHIYRALGGGWRALDSPPRAAAAAAADRSRATPSVAMASQTP